MCLNHKKFQLVIGHLGGAYFENGAVSDLAERDKGTWSAIVTGAKDYYVKIKFSGDVISQCACDCPLETEYCKHIVAVLQQNNLILIRMPKV